MISSFGFRQLHTHQFAMLLPSPQPMFDRPVLAFIDDIRHSPGFLWSILGLTVRKSGFDFIDQLLDRRPFGQIVVQMWSQSFEGGLEGGISSQDVGQGSQDAFFASR
jgi:hypothetical protein